MHARPLRVDFRGFELAQIILLIQLKLVTKASAHAVYVHPYRSMPLILMMEVGCPIVHFDWMFGEESLSFAVFSLSSARHRQVYMKTIRSPRGKDLWMHFFDERSFCRNTPAGHRVGVHDMILHGE